MTLPALAPAPAPADIAALKRLDERVLWLASWTIHNANHLRESRDGLKVGGHQASCASMTSLMTALYFHTLRPEDRVAVKPHASPVYHAIQTLFGRQSVEQLQRFRAFGGAQSYPSRTKDKDDVDFSTGSVGLGVAVTAFASLVQDYLTAHRLLPEERRGRFIALLGDAELDEGNIYEALIEAYKHDIRNTWWIVDYNRQSLDATTSDRMWDRFDDIFETAGWEVLTLKYGARQRAAFAEPGGEALRDWIDHCPNALYAALTYEGGAAWRERLMAELPEGPPRALIARYSDEALSELMTQLGGHCLETILEAYARAAADDRPKLLIAYTVKGWRLPFQGHKDNHAGLMTPAQVEALRAQLGVPVGQEWDALAGLAAGERARLDALIAGCPFAAPVQRRFQAPEIAIPGRFPVPDGASQSTQAAFGKILNELARENSAFAARLVTTSPDVTVSTNLGAFVNRRGLFRRSATTDVFKDRRIASPQTWAGRETGQHIELGIAEHNLFLMLAALGLSGPLHGERLFPIGTLYDPFIARGLDALNYACYQDARFLLVATPSGLTLGPEGGAHQSINTPLIGMGQPGLSSWEPAFADELALLMRRAFARMQEPEGESAYLRLSTRMIDQPARADDAWEAGALEGGYWLRAPAPGADLAIVYQGAVAPEALAAWEAVQDDHPGAGLLAVTSTDRLHKGWTAAGRSRWTSGRRNLAHVEQLLAPLAPQAGLVTVLDGAPAALSWLGSVRGMRVRALGVERFGQTGDLPDLYAEYRLDADAILDAAADLALR
jgi:pyruvate dehydrogenase E1 component